MTPEFLALMERYNKRGRMLPQGDTLDGVDVDAVRLVLREMAEVKAKIDALLGKNFD